MDYEEMGQRWLRGEVEITEFEGITLNKKQIDFINRKERFNLVCGGMASGKTLGWTIKFILLMLWFPGTRILIGRKTKGNAASTFMKDFVDVCPDSLYEYKVGDGKIIFANGSEAVFFGLDALQSGNGDDLKKAIQDLKSHNFGFVFIDQLEEIEMKVFEALNSRMRRRQCKHAQKDQTIYNDEDGLPLYEVCNICGKATFNQMNFTTNPANFWGYDYFKANPRAMTYLMETSMLDNREFLSEQFIQSELAKPARYVQKFVHGEWSPDSMVEGAVFADDYVKQQEFYIKKPIREFDGIKIFQEPKYEDYQIGVDPSQGAVDPCSIKVFSKKTGEEVASYSAFVPTNVITDKTVMLALMYSLKSKPLVVPDSTGGGQALVESLKKVYNRIYEREVFLYREKRNVKKLGFNMSHATKSQLVDNLTELFQKRFVKIRDKSTLDEFKVFVYTDEVRNKGAGAQTGYHDDRVTATMLALWNVPAQTHREKNLLNRVQKNNKKGRINYQYE